MAKAYKGYRAYKAQEAAVRAAAEKELIDAIKAFPSANKAAEHATMIAGYDVKNGKIAVGKSDHGTILADETKNYIEGKLGKKLGEKTNLYNNKVGSCAEVDAANKLVNQGVAIQNVKFTDALRPRNVWKNEANNANANAVVKTCENCKATWSERNFK